MSTEGLSPEAKMARLQALTVAAGIINEHALTAGRRLREELHLTGDALVRARCAFLVIIDDLREEREALVNELAMEALEGNPLQQ